MNLIEIIGKHLTQERRFIQFYGGDCHSFVINVNDISYVQSWICDIFIDDESLADPYCGDCTLLTYKDTQNCKGESQMAVFEPYRSFLCRLYEGKFFAPKLTRLDLISNPDSELPANFDRISDYEYKKFKEAEAKRNENE